MDYQAINIGKLSNSRLRSLARDLEKLPCELHPDILLDLTFEQLVRLSHCAGARLTWSLENSIAHWGRLFEGGNFQQWQDLLSLTDKIRFLCFKLPAEKGQRPYLFTIYDLCFLEFHGREWGPDHSTPRAGFNREELAKHWLASLNEHVMNATWTTFHEKHARMIEPWVDHILGAVELFAKIPVARGYKYAPMTLSVEELGTFIEVYQKLRSLRAEALSRELLRLADVYEAHPEILTTPSAPQPRPNVRPFNPKHQPQMLRHEARRLIKRAKTTRWTEQETCKYRFLWKFPGLIPYDWATQLFNWALEEPVLHKDMAMDESTAKTPKSQQCRILIGAAPAWMGYTPAKVTGPDSVANLLKKLKVPQPDSAKTKEIVDKGYREAYRPLPEAELDWLETFAEVTVWMEGEFPILRQDLRKQDEERAARRY